MYHLWSNNAPSRSEKMIITFFRCQRWNYSLLNGNRSKLNKIEENQVKFSEWNNTIELQSFIFVLFLTMKTQVECTNSKQVVVKVSQSVSPNLWFPKTSHNFPIRQVEQFLQSTLHLVLLLSHICSKL
jgi:hypothetical protein